MEGKVTMLHFTSWKRYCNQRRLIGFVSATLFILIVYKANETPKLNTSFNELKHHMRQIEKECGNFNQNQNLVIDNSKADKTLVEHFCKPQCDNLLKNVTQGFWKLNDSIDVLMEKQIKSIHKKFREKMGIPLQPWREDFKCGFRVKAQKISNLWPQTASFCNPQSKKQCCSNNNDGMCISHEQCDCQSCINVADQKEALFSRWTVRDSRCQWKNYTELQACSILNKLSNEDGVSEIHFVGDSLMRNMFMGFTSILTADIKKGIHKTCVSKELEENCWGENLFVFRPCHDLVAAHSLEELKRSDLCGGRRQFRAQYDNIAMPSQAEDLLSIARKLHGKKNAFIILGVGLHFHCKHQDVIDKFLKPIIDMLQYKQRTWPRLLWVHPLSVGLLKPPAYWSTQGDEAIQHFAANMEIFLGKYDIPVFDFRQVTKGVHSYDGTHYGAGVNIIKAQILLNYLATITI